MAKLAGGHSQGETVVKPFLRQLRRGQAEKNVDKQGTCYNTFAAVRENGNGRTTQTTGDLTLGLSPRCEQPPARRR